MCDEILLTIGEDGVAIEYDDTWDIVIHCESKEEHDATIKRLTGLESRWISCKERLPEEDGDYFVTFEKGYAEDYGLDLVGIAPYEVDCEGFGIWQEEFDPHTLGSLGSEWVDINVIAWQPLPKRYREEGGEE